MAINRSNRRNAWIIVATLAILACGLGGIGYWRRSDPLLEARHAYEQGDWAEAVRLVRDRLKVDQDDLDAIRLLARSNARLGRDDLAVSLYQNRLRIDRMEAEDEFLLGTMIERQGDPALALKVWQKALAANPDNPDLLHAVALGSIRAGRPEVSAEAARRLIGQPDQEARGQIALGIAQSRMDDDAGAVAALLRGLALDPAATTSILPNSGLKNLLARHLINVGRPADALAIVDEPGDSGPNDASESAWLRSRARLALGEAPDSDPALVSAYRDVHPLMPEPGPFLGAERCIACHREISETSTQSRHGRTFHRGAELLKLPLPDGSRADPDRPEVSHSMQKQGERVVVATSDPKKDKAYRLLVEFAFGTPERYVTMVGRDEQGAFRAARLSSYQSAGSIAWDRTSGDAGDSEHTADVRGQAIHTREGVVRCLGCHVTNPRDFLDGVANPTPAVADRAIGCERCHGPGTAHVAAVKLGLADPAIVNAGRSSGRAINEQCRGCHIVGDAAEIARTPDDPKWVRSPGVTLSASRCFIQSTGRLTCVTCHDPHRDSPTNSEAYESKCLSCHSSGGETAQAVCKVNPTSGCVGCHMPKVPVASLHTSLTDHFIRIHREGPGAAPAPR